MVVSSNHYTDIDLVVANDGTVDAAGVLNRRIWWLTNRTGSWTTVGLSDPPGKRSDAEPAIARDGSALWVAFTRLGPPDAFGRLPEGVYYLGRNGGNWSEPQGYGPFQANSPSIAAGDGNVHLTYAEGVAVDVLEEGAEFPLHYATNRTGTWTDVVVSENGTDPNLQLTSNGQARMCFGDSYELMAGDALRYALAGSPADDFTIEKVPDTRASYLPLSCAIDANDRIHLVWATSWQGEVDGLYYARRGANGWGPVQTLLPNYYVNSVSITADAGNAVHVIATTIHDGAWYFTNRHGTWEKWRVLEPSGEGFFEAASDIGVDAFGRAHMLIVAGEGGNSTMLWYAASPSV